MINLELGATKEEARHLMVMFIKVAIPVYQYHRMNICIYVNIYTRMHMCITDYYGIYIYIYKKWTVEDQQVMIGLVYHPSW